MFTHPTQLWKHGPFPLLMELNFSHIPAQNLYLLYKRITLPWSVSMQVLRDVGMETSSPLTFEVTSCQRKKKSKVPFQIKMNLLIIYLYMRHCVPWLAIWTQHAEYHWIETLPWCCQMQDCICGKPIRKPSGFAWASSLTPFLAHEMKWQRGHCQTFQSRSSSQWYTHGLVQIQLFILSHFIGFRIT